MKNTTSIIITTLCLISATQIYGMEPEKNKKIQPQFFIAFVHNPIIFDANKAADPLKNKSEDKQHCITQNRPTVISDLNALQNRIGEEQLSLIHNELMQQYESQNTILKNSQEDRLAIVFAEFSIQRQLLENLSALVFDKKSILSSTSQPSTLEKLQHCLYVSVKKGE